MITLDITEEILNISYYFIGFIYNKIKSGRLVKLYILCILIKKRPHSYLIPYDGGRFPICVRPLLCFLKYKSKNYLTILIPLHPPWQNIE